MIKNSTISEIIYGKLFYKNITTLILAAIFFFFLTITLFILYQIRVANLFSKQVEVDLNNLVLNAEKLIEKIEPNLENSKQDPLWKGYSHHTEMTDRQKRNMEKDCQKAGSTMYRREKLERCRDSGLFDPSEYSWTGWRYKKR